MQYKKLTEEELIRLANSFMVSDWEVVKPSSKWDGYDIVSDNCIFQLSYNGTIRIYNRETIIQQKIDIMVEDTIRKELQQIMSAYE